MAQLRPRKKNSLIDEPSINITPLIDVVFVILIAFIMIAPLLELDRVALAQGTPNHQSVHFDDASPVQIHVYSNNQIAFNNAPITLKDLPSKLALAKSQYPKARAQLYHDKSAHFGTYQSIKNALEDTGFQEVDVVLLPS